MHGLFREVALTLLIISAVSPSIWSESAILPGDSQPSPTHVGYRDIQDLGGCEYLNATVPKPAVLKCSVTPSDDVYVDNLFPTKGYGDLPVLIAQDTPSIPKSRNYAFLKFDLSRSLPSALLGTHARPDNATLQMYVRLVSFSYNASIRVYRVPSNAWDELSVTWSTMPAYDSTVYASRDIVANGTWFAWNVKEATSIAAREGDKVSLAAIPSSSAWRNYVWFDSKDRKENVPHTWPTLKLVFVEPSLTLVTKYPHLPITIGDQTFETDSNGTVETYLPWGNYKISVPEVIPQGDGSREFFVDWGDNVAGASRVITLGNNLSLSANYRTQYKLDATSSYASINGSDWYFENTPAHLSVYPTAVPAEGLAGLIGVRHVFEHWTGDCTQPQPECTLTMDGPKKATAIWRDDYTITASALIILAAVAAVVLALRRRRQRGKPQKRLRRDRHR